MRLAKEKVPTLGTSTKKSVASAGRVMWSLNGKMGW
jgi:hypothetical protein